MCKKIHFCACTGECLSKVAEQNFQKKPVIALIFKALVISLNLGDIQISLSVSHQVSSFSTTF